MGFTSRIRLIPVVIIVTTGYCFLAAAAPLPTDPISPTHKSECDELYASYQALHADLAGQARQAGDEAWRLVRQSNSINPPAAATRLYANAANLRDEASDVLSAGSRARSRCMSAVAAYKRNSSVMAETQRTMEDMPARAGRAVGDAAFDSALKLIQQTGGRRISGSLAGPLSAEGTLALGGLRSAFHAYGGFDGLLGRSGAGGELGFGGNLALRGLGGLVKWNVLQRTLVKNSLEAILDVHRSALADLDAALERLDEPPQQSLASRLSSLSAKTSVEVMSGRGGGGGASRVAPEGDDLGATYALAREQHRLQEVARSESSSRAMAAAAAERKRAAAAAEAQRRATVRRSTPQQQAGQSSRRQPPRQSSPSSGAGVAAGTVSGMTIYCVAGTIDNNHDPDYPRLACQLARPLGGCGSGSRIVSSGGESWMCNP